MILPIILQFYLFLGHFLPVVYELRVTRSRASGNTSSTADIMITWNYDDCCIPVFIPKHYSRRTSKIDKKNQPFFIYPKTIGIDSNPFRDTIDKISTQLIEPLSFKLPFTVVCITVCSGVLKNVVYIWLLM